MRRVLFAALAACALAGAVASADGAPTGPGREYVVLYEHGASGKAARAAIADAGGRVVSENTDIGVATVRSSTRLVRGRRRAEPRDRRRHHQPRHRARPERRRQGQARPGREGQLGRIRGSHGKGHAAKGADPLAGLPVGHADDRRDADGLLRAPAGRRTRSASASSTPASTAATPTSRRTSTRTLSRNFTDRRPGRSTAPCDDDPDQSCDDPPNVDEDGHGTHVAGTIASPLNGIGIAGVAPEGRRSSTSAPARTRATSSSARRVDALTYAGDHGIDVVNMWYYIDPWLYNCAANPADSPAEQREQRHDHRRPRSARSTTRATTA